MTNPYEYVGKSLTPSIAQELIQKLFAGQTVRKQEIIKKVDEVHLTGGGLPSKAQFHHPVTLALSDMRLYRLVKNPEFGVWSILPIAGENEVEEEEVEEENGGADPDPPEGAEEVHITTLNEFMDWTQQFAPGEYLFRGISNEKYGIEASAYRRLKTEAERNLEKFLEVNKELIKDARLRGHDQKNGREFKDLEILAELQHFRAATCLIDFTFSAQIALWFACQPSSESLSNGKIVAVRNKLPRLKEVTPDLLEKPIDYFLQDSDQSQPKQLYQWQPWQLNNRIGAQQSIFLFGNVKIDPDEECIIKADSKQYVLTALQQSANITEAILFPDFDGFARLRDHEIPYAPLSAAEYREHADQATQKGKYKEAVDSYDIAIQLDPDDTEAYHRRGLAKSELEQYEEAITDYDIAIRLNPNDEKVYYNRGLAKYYLKRYEDAIADYDEAIRLKPNDEYSYHNRGLAKNGLERYENAIIDFDEAIHINPNDVYFHYHRGLANNSLEQYEDAIADFDETIRQQPDNVNAYQQRGFVKQKQGEVESAITDYDMAILLNSNDGKVYYNRGLMKLHCNRSDEAKKDFEKGLRLAEETSDEDLIAQISKQLNELTLPRGDIQ